MKPKNIDNQRDLGKIRNKEYSKMPKFPEIFPQVEVKTLKKDKVQPGFTLCNLSNHESRLPITVVLLDHEGNLHWWFQHGNTPDMRGDIDVRTVPEGVLIGGTNIVEKDKNVPPILVNWKGEILWKGKITNHHHIHRTSEGNYMFLIVEERYFKHLNITLVGDVIVEYNPESDRVVWKWHLFDHVRPEVRRRDWSHCNTIEPDPRDENLYLSARNLNSIFKINRKTEKIVWRFGEDGNFDISPEDRFYQQHSPEIQSNGNLLLFDNGTSRPKGMGGEYSRALELCLDEESMKAEAVWSWRNSPDLFTPIWGDADRLKNGNILITFGNRVPPSPYPIDIVPFKYKIPTQTSRIIEVSPSGEKVWELEFSPAQWGVYRAERVNEKRN